MEQNTEDAGNGSVMRLAPMPIFFRSSVEQMMMYSAESSYTTHPGPIAAAACSLMGFIIWQALNREVGSQLPASKFLDQCVADFMAREGLSDLKPSNSETLDPKLVLLKLLRSEEGAGSKERCWNWRDPKGPFLVETLKARGRSYNGYPVSAGYFGSYCMDGLALALHCFYHTDSFMGAVVKCVNYLGDADSIGSICGQIAGAFYGYSKIDPRFIKELEQWDAKEVALRGALLCALAPPKEEGSANENIPERWSTKSMKFTISAEEKASHATDKL